MDTRREAWLDAIRGITISLVILNHCIQASAALVALQGKELHFLVFNINNALGLVRMPAFFLCSGILFAIGAKRGWNWFVKKRLLWTAWIIALWSWLALLFMGLGFHLYPWNRPEGIDVFQVLLIEPIGNMWFVYAIAILGAFCMAIRSMPPAASLIIAFILSIMAIFSVEIIEFPDGIERTLWNLGTRGLLFFTIGFIFSKQLMLPRKGSLAGAIVALAIWAICSYIMKKVGGSSNFYRMALSIPATFSAVYVLQYLLAQLPAVATLIGYLGKRSLQLFLLHQFFIATVFVVLQNFVRQASSIVLLATMFLTVIMISYIVANILEKVPGNPFFAVPHRTKEPQKQSFPTPTG